MGGTIPPSQHACAVHISARYGLAARARPGPARGVATVASPGLAWSMRRSSTRPVGVSRRKSASWLCTGKVAFQGSGSGLSRPAGSVQERLYCRVQDPGYVGWLALYRKGFLGCLRVGLESASWLCAGEVAAGARQAGRSVASQRQSSAHLQGALVAAQVAPVQVQHATFAVRSRLVQLPHRNVAVRVRAASKQRHSGLQGCRDVGGRGAAQGGGLDREGPRRSGGTAGCQSGVCGLCAQSTNSA